MAQTKKFLGKRYNVRYELNNLDPNLIIIKWGRAINGTEYNFEALIKYGICKVFVSKNNEYVHII